MAILGDRTVKFFLLDCLCFVISMDVNVLPLKELKGLLKIQIKTLREGAVCSPVVERVLELHEVQGSILSASVNRLIAHCGAGVPPAGPEFTFYPSVMP